MVTFEGLSIVIGSIGIVFVVGATSPAIKLLTTAIGHPKKVYGDELLYEDDDGVATEETASAYSDRVPKSILYLATILGFLTSLALSVFASLRPEQSLLIESWLMVLCWVSLNPAFTFRARRHPKICGYTMWTPVCSQLERRT